MFVNTSHDWGEKEYIVRLPKEEIWFVQNILHTSQGAALVTMASMRESYGEVVAITNTDQEKIFLRILGELQKCIPSIQYNVRNS
jgi:UTP:GlnB (protein PII) uridylyltransferase